MVRKSAVVAVAAALLLATVVVPARGIATPSSPGRTRAPFMVAGRVASIDGTAQAVGVRTAEGTVTVSTNASTTIVGLDESYGSSEATTIAFSGIRLGDWAGAYGAWQPDGSLLATTLLINHRDFHITGRVKSIDTTGHALRVGWVNWKRHVVRSTIKYTDRTRVLQRGRRVSISRINVGSVIHVDGFGSNDGLIAKRIVILWRGRSRH